MKTIQIGVIFLIIVITTWNCSAESKENNNTKITITLSGEDTNVIGTQLEVGDIAYGRKDLTGLENTIVIVSKGATILENTPLLSPNNSDYMESIINFPDKENSFVIVAGEQLVSITIVTNGEERKYTCDSIFKTSINCGSVILDKDLKKGSFINTTVKNTKTGTVLTMNGTLQW